MNVYRMKNDLLVGVGPGSRTTNLLIRDIRVDGLSKKASIDTTVLDAVLECVSYEYPRMITEEDMISTYLLLTALLNSVAAEITNRHIGRHSESY